MDIIIKISALAIISAVCALTLRKSTPELSLLLTIAALLFLCTLIGNALQSAADLTKEIARFANITPEFLTPLLKVLGISVITKISADICKDAGSSSLAGVTELAGNTVAIITAIPLISSLLKFVSSI